MNKKLTKLLSVFLIAGLIGTGTAVGVAGCKKDKGPGTTNNQTEQTINWNMKGHGTKPSDAAAKTSGGKVTKPTDPANVSGYRFDGWFSDDACSIPFNFNETYNNAVTVYAKWTPTSSSEGIDITKEFAKEDYDAATEASGKRYLEIGSEIVTGVSVAGVADLEIEANNKKIYYGGAEKAVGYRVKFGADLYTAKAATGDAEAYNELKRALKVEVAEDATLVIYGTSGTSGKTAYISLAEGVTEGEVTKLTIVDTQQVCFNNDVNAAVFEVKAGKTYYVGSDMITAKDSNAANANIYYLEIKSDFDEGKGEKVAAADATCETKGNVAYYYTAYGRYLDEDEKVLNPNDVFSAALGHKWSYTDVTKPTATDPGSVTLTCGRVSQHTETVTLPALKSTLYEREEITEGENAGKYSYSFAYLNVYDGEEQVDVITFVDDYVKPAKTEYVDISGFDYSVDGDDFVEEAGSEPEAIGTGGLKLTAGTNNGGKMGKNESLNVSFVDGAIYLDDTESANILYGVVGFDEAKTTGAYRVSGKIHAVAAGNWDPVQIVTSTDISSDQDSKILFALSSGQNKKYSMKFAGERRTESAFAVNDSDEYLFRMDIDLDNHIATISISLDGEEWAEIDTVTDASIKTFAGVRFQTGSGSRSFHVKDLMIAEKMEVPEAVGEYKVIAREYNLGVSSFVADDDIKLKINGNKTFTTTVYSQTYNGTWEQEDGKSYYTCKYTVQGHEQTMYVEFDEANGVLYSYEAVEDIATKSFSEAFIMNGKEITAAVGTVLDAADYEKVEPGEEDNPIVITALSPEAVTKTGVGNDDIYYQYKNTGDEAVKVTIIPGANTGIMINHSGSNETKTISIDSGSLFVFSIYKTEQDATELSFTFRAYDANVDTGVSYSITFVVGEESDETVGSVDTGNDGKLADLPELDDTDFYTFEGWYMLDKEDNNVKVDVDADTVYTENTTLYAKWEAKGVIFEQTTYTYDFSKIAKTDADEKSAVTQADLDGTQNAFLKAVNENGNAVIWRKPGNSRIEVSNGGLQVYFGSEGGSLTLKVKSTGDNSDSLIGLKNAAGEYIAASEKAATIDAVTQEALDDGGIEVNGNKEKVALTADEIGTYIVHNGNLVEITFTVSEAGWYTIYSDKTKTTRGICVMNISQTVNKYMVLDEDFTETSVELSETEVEIDEQDSVTITADIDTNDGVYITKIEWKTSDAEVATVENGVITVHKKGATDTVVITCEVTDSLGNKVSATVTVTVNHVGVTGVSITDDADEGTLKKDDTKQLHYEVSVDGEGEATDIDEVQWDSSNTAVATVSDTGLVTIVGAGNTDITVTIIKLDGTTKTSEAYAITVAAVAATGLKDIAAVSVDAGKKVDIVVEVEPDDANGYDLTYVSNDTSVATVDNSGKVTGVAAGTTTVTVTLKIGEQTIATKDCAVTVTTAQVITGTLQPTAASEAAGYSDANISIIAKKSDSENYNFVSRGELAPTDGWWTGQSGSFTITNKSTEDLYVTVTAAEVDGKGLKSGKTLTFGTSTVSGVSALTAISCVIKAGESAEIAPSGNKLTFSKIEYTSVIPAAPAEGE